MKFHNPLPSLKPNIHSMQPEFKFKRVLDPPWEHRLGTYIKIVSALTLANTFLLLLLGLISAASVDLSADKRPSEQDYISTHSLLLHAELVFFYLTIPFVYVCTNVTENWVLWEDKLRPLYVIAAALIAVNVWVLQLVIWGPCLFAKEEDGGGLKGPGYCPYLFRDGRVDLGKMQMVGSPRMVFWCVPTLFILYIAYLTLGMMGYRRDRKRPKRFATFDLSKSNAYSMESIPFRDTWAPRESTSNSPPKTSPDRDSYLSPKTSRPPAAIHPDDKDSDGETTPSFRDEPAIALMLTTPHGTTKDQNPFDDEGSFDDDRLSRLGHRPL